MAEATPYVGLAKSVALPKALPKGVRPAELKLREESYTQEEKEKLGKVYAIVLEALDRKSKDKRNHSLEHKSRLKEGFRAETP